MRFSIVKAVIYCILFALSVVWLFPLASMFMVIVKSNEEFSSLPYWGFPRLKSFVPNLSHNIGIAWKKTHIGVFFINSVIFATLAGVGSAFVASLAGYALTQLKVKTPQAWFIGIFIGNVFPFQMFLIPLYLFLNYIKLYDTRIGLSLVYVGICVPFALFVYRNYAYTLPGELFDAAKVDGASKWGSYIRLFIPMSKPAFLVIFCFQFIWTWNDLIFGLVLSERYRPVMTSLSKLQGQRGGVPPPILITGAIIASIPTVIILLTMQKYFVRGFTLTIEK
jgi:multiple sugar transport system permease protein